MGVAEVIFMICFVVASGIVGAAKDGSFNGLRDRIEAWAEDGKLKPMSQAQIEAADRAFWMEDNEAAFGRLKQISVQNDWCLSHPWADGSPTAGVIARLRRDFYNDHPDDPMDPLPVERFEACLGAALADKERFDRDKTPTTAAGLLADVQNITEPVKNPTHNVEPNRDQRRQAAACRRYFGVENVVERYNKVRKNSPQRVGWLRALLAEAEGDPRVESVLQFEETLPIFLIYDGSTNAARARSDFERAFHANRAQPSMIWPTTEWDPAAGLGSER